MRVTRLADLPRPPGGFGLFNLGFRPFYLLAALLACAGMMLWLAQLAGYATLSGPVAGVHWHGHEMVFGFAVAVIAGFLLTAVRNWTGLPTPSGPALATIAMLWIAGRIALLAMPEPWAGLVDVAFLPVVAIALWVPLQRARNRNRFFVGLMLLLAGANAMFHFAVAGSVTMSPSVATRFALYVIATIVTIMGGRVIPSFTANAIPAARIRKSPALVRAAIGCSTIALLCVLADAPDVLVGVLCGIAALLHGLRAWNWDPISARAAPILWILHLSYAWVPVGLALHALSALGAPVPVMLADHALAVGGVGGVIIGMITRTARGHSGLPLQVGRLEIAAYALVHVAAVLRVLLPIVWPAGYAFGLQSAGLCWSVAFALYLWVYAPILVRPRVDGRPG